MAMTPRLRTFMLTAHIIFSVGWFGAVAAFLALAVAGLVSEDAPMVHAAYLAMELIAWFVIVPLSFASTLTGLIQSLGTTWGLFRHYWILVKFLITIPSTIFLLFHMQPISRLADAAAKATLAGIDLSELRIQLAIDSGAALLVLLMATTLAMYKPRGMTRYGARKQYEQGLSSTASTPQWVKVLGIIVFVLVLLFVVLHTTGHSLGGH